ncbi:hypothetical protein I8752_35495 [Nostocaceae cyanobacterium CENA369]|uniref:Uncharacterized protein n=1 Tax=Dendronalium phyllosphericum CENA369 TaxID=1725256 RepID=A0A8J7I8P5_9NOST|nr:hypothetical protein [Dendronalium phyllosphericum]MBH8578161.1 hypothetical protein [Dendronalium phyllosphericum CENA369]
MSNSPDRLYELLPAVYRIRDVEQGYPLRDLLRVIAEQVNIVEADITQLYENWFIETCQDWVVPYIGDLIGYQNIRNYGTNAIADEKGNNILIPRREVANTIRYRRRKGTLALLELLADKVAGWPARVVEFDRLVSKTQHINHPHSSSSTTVNLHQVNAVAKLNNPFEELAHTVDIHNIASQYQPGKYNTPNVGIFVWRLKPYSMTLTPAFCLEEVSSNCYTFSITGNDTPLYTRPQIAEDETKIARELNLPIPIQRQVLQSCKSDYFDSNPNPEQFSKSLQVWKGVGAKLQLISPEQIIIADLGDWNYQPEQDHIAVDPELGRMIFPIRQLPKNGVWVSYYYGFSADIGGGEYDRTLLDSATHFLLDVGDIQEPVVFISQQDASALSQFLRSQLSGDTRRLLDAYIIPPAEPALITALLRELNQLLLGKSLYDKQRFAAITLSAETQRLIQQNLYGKELIRCNRLLLEEAFPSQIRKHYIHYSVSQTSQADYQSITEAILQWQRDKPHNAVIEIFDSGVYVERINIELEKNQSLQLRAANRKRPVIRILDWRTSLGDALNITVESGSCFVLDGLLITGRGVHIEGNPTQFVDYPTSVVKSAAVIIRHSTLVPGWSLHCDCEPRRSSEPSLELFNINGCVTIAHSIVGSIQVNQDEVEADPLPICISDSIIDATNVEGEAIGAVGYSIAHARLTIARCTVIGQIQVHAIDLAENSIFKGIIFVARRQQGCIRFCYVMPNSRTPRRYNCQPDLVEQIVRQKTELQPEQIEVEQLVARSRVQPQFNSTRYGTPTYCQLASTCAEEIKRGADDESEMGAFHNLYQPQKEANLRIRLEEYTPADTEINIIYAS